MSVSGILPSGLLCDESGADCGLTHCAQCLLLWITGSGKPRVLKNWHISSAFSEKSVSSLHSIHSDEGLTLETSVFESFTVANLP